MYQYLIYAIVSFQSAPDNYIVHETKICSPGEEIYTIFICIKWKKNVIFGLFQYKNNFSLFKKKIYDIYCTLSQRIK